MARRRLKTSADVRRFLAELINRHECGEITPEKARTSCYLGQNLLRAVEAEASEKLSGLQDGNDAPPISVTFTVLPPVATSIITTHQGRQVIEPEPPNQEAIPCNDHK